MTYRVVLASVLTSLLNICAFALLFSAIVGLRNATKVTDRTAAVLVSAQGLQRLLVDLEVSQHGYQLTRDEKLLQPWNAAHAAFPAQAANLDRLAVRMGPEQEARARDIVRAADSYIRDYSVPVVAAARRGDVGSASAVKTIEQAEQRLSGLRSRLDTFETVQRRTAETQRRHSVVALRGVTVTAGTAVLLSLCLVALFVGYVARMIVRPIRRAAIMAGELAGGDLAVRMPETSPGEIGVLEHAVNALTGSLAKSRDKLVRVAQEQRALRRVATLVARGVSPAEIFDAVAGELGRVLIADYTQIIRFEPDDTATVVSYWSEPSAPNIMPPLDGHWPIEEGTIAALVQQTRRPARMTDYERATSQIGTWVRVQGIRCVVGCPVQVEGHIWGSAIIFSYKSDPPELTENRMLEFVELVATAIANAESRTKLVASRARVVAASDETRRCIERNLHDGAQQRLVALGLELRSAQAALPGGQEEVKEQLSRMAHGLTSVIHELQEMSRGLHPAVLSRGVEPALKGLARRSAVPVELSMHVGRRLPERVEVAVYYAASEALNNVAKHAHATVARIHLAVEDMTLRLSIQDDGIGGADPRRGSGLIGLNDRIDALEGRIRVSSPIGAGTTLLVDIPLADG